MKELLAISISLKAYFVVLSKGIILLVITTVEPFRVKYIIIISLYSVSGNLKLYVW